LPTATHCYAKINLNRTFQVQSNTSNKTSEENYITEGSVADRQLDNRQSAIAHRHTLFQQPQMRPNMSLPQGVHGAQASSLSFGFWPKPRQAGRDRQCF
jgi:hypothetical protein